MIPDLAAIIAAAGVGRQLKLRDDLAEPGWTFRELRTLNRHRVVGLMKPFRQFADTRELETEIRTVIARHFTSAWWRGLAYGVVVQGMALPRDPAALQLLVDARNHPKGTLQWVVLVDDHSGRALGVHTWLEGYLSPVYRGTLAALAEQGYPVARVVRGKDGLMQFLTALAKADAFPEFRD